MAAMTWGEFKAFVEASGVQNNWTIEYMDFSYPDQAYGSSSIDVYLDEEHQIFDVH